MAPTRISLGAFTLAGTFVLLVLTFIWKRRNSTAATVSILFGLLFCTYNLFIALSVDLPAFCDIASVQQALTGMIASAVLFIGMSILSKSETAKANAFIA